MMRRSDLRAAQVLARTELGAMWRRLTDSRRRMLGIGLGALQFVVVFPLFVLDSALELGARLAGGSPPVGAVGAYCVAAGVFGLYLGGMTAINQNRIGSVGPLIRTSVPPPAVSAGRLASETVQSSVLFVLPIAVVLIEVGVGAGGPLAPALLGVSVFAFMVVGLLVGRTAGAAARYAGVLARLSAWTKAAAFVAVMVAFFVGVQALIGAFLPEDAGFGASASIPPFLPGRPVQATAGAFLAPLGANPRLAGVLGIAVLFAAIPVWLALAVRAETTLLLSGVGADGDEEAVATRPVPRPFTAAPSTRIAFRHLLRTARDPKSVAHLMPVLFGALGAGAGWITEPDFLFTIGPPAMVVLGVAIAGLLYCLNPLGDDREQLPLLLTSVASPAVLLRGRLVASSAVGLAFAVGLGAPLATLENPPAYVALQTGLGIVLVVAGAATALGLGAFAPTFERREYMNVERAHPSQRATMGFLFGGSTVAGGGMALAWFTVHRNLALSLLAGAWVGYLALVGALGVGGYVYAVRTFEDFTLDDM
jgi:hypothetical protein